MQISEAAGGIPAAGVEPCRFPKLEECAHFHYERVQLPQLVVTLQTNLEQSLHSQHSYDDCSDWYMVQVTSTDECWLVQRSYENFKMLDAQLHQCIFDRKISQLPDLASHPSYGEDIATLLIEYLVRFSEIADNSLNCGPVLNWFQMDNKGHRLLVPSEESRSINTPAVAAAYSIRRYVSQARDELNLEVGDMISVIDMASPAESVWWRGKRGFQVGFFPQHCVHIIGDKVPRNMPLPPPVVGSLAVTPVKPVLRKHGKLIAFFRSFILNRPSRRRLKQSGILKERVFGCDLGEHLLNSGHDIPTVLKCCTEFIEKHGIVDGIFRLSGVTSNIQKLRNAFDEDRIPDLYTEDILQDIHSVASLLKMYFRELPNPLCTYQLYQSFVNAVQGCNNINRNSISDRDRLLKMREAVQKLPPPHYRTLEYLMRHLSRVAQHASSTGMTTRNIAIVWAPNLLRCAELEVGGVAALQGVGVQAVVTEFLICYADLIFCDHLPSLNQASFDLSLTLSPKRNRPKSLAISTPAKLLTLEEARSKHLLNKPDESGYIEVGGGPKNLPKMYHTVIELPAGSRKRNLSKRSPSVWRSFFSKSRSSSRSQGSLTKNRKSSTPGNINTDNLVTETDITEMKRKLRPVKSAESLTSGHSEPASTEDILGPLHTLSKPPGHNRSVSHDSYFDTLQNSQHNSEGSLYDLSEIQLNFDLEESEMHIFSEDESLVSSPRVQKDSVYRRVLTRARPEDMSSTNNSNNPSPKKQARVVISPDSTSRKRTRLEDQLSDIQYIDCNTPDNTCVITTTTAVIHSQPETFPVELYQPKNKSPRNSEIVETKRQSLDFEKPEKATVSISKSFTESNIQSKLIIPSNQSSSFTSPQSPVYKQLEDSSTTTTPDYAYQTFIDKLSDDNENDKTVTIKNVISPISKNNKSSPTYENVLTTISITYKSPCKSPKTSSIDDDVYEDVLNIEHAVIPTSTASLPLQEASQGRMGEHNSALSLPDNLTTLSLSELNEQRPKSLNALENINEPNSHREKCSSLTIITAPYIQMHETEKRSLTDLSLSEVVQSSIESTTSQSSISFPISPSKNSLSPIVSPMIFCDGSTKTLSEDILRSLSPSLASLLEAKTHSSGSSLIIDDNNKCSPSVESSEEIENHLVCYRQVNPEYLKLTDNNISSNEDDISPVRIVQANPENSMLVTVNNEIPITMQRSFPDQLVLEDVSPKVVNKFSSKINVQLRERPIDLNVEPVRPKSINLIEFSPSEPPVEGSGKVSTNDKRKSCETGLVDDENTVYQQVKYFRSSVSEINALLDRQEVTTPVVESPEAIANINQVETTTVINSESEPAYDSLESNNVHIYENFELQNCNPQIEEPVTCIKPTQLKEKPNVRSLMSHFEVKETHQKPPIYKRNEERSKFTVSKTYNDDVSAKIKETDFGSTSSLESIKVQRLMYDRGSLPPCLRARNMKYSIKTRSLDEEAFVKEFSDSHSLERRNSVDENFGSKYHNLPKSLNQPKPIPIEVPKVDIHLAHSTDSISINLPELNRERIEKYKEERRKFLHDKYRSESFKEDKDILLSRLKTKGSKSNKTLNESSSTRISSSDPGPCSELLKQTKNETEPPDADDFKDSLECDIDKQVSLSDSNSDLKKESIKYRTALFESHLNQNKQQTADCDSTTTTTKAAKIIESNKLLFNNPKKVQEYKSPVNIRKNISVIESDSDILGDILGENDFIRNRRRDDDCLKNERRRHTYETRERERESEADRVRRISLESRNLRKDTKSPSYCIKDMKAIFESKSHQ